jgi:nifR3 family TIM-barrel protein
MRLDMRIGKLPIDAPFYQAGLAGYSDAAMRLVARRHGCPYAVTEAMLDLFLIRGGKGLRAAELDNRDHPIAGQLMGSHPDEIAQAAQVLVGLGYDVIDINLACPVKKIRRRSRGGHLLQAPDEAIAILRSVREVVPSGIPCSVKLRRGTDDTPEAAARFYQIFEAAMELGYAAATVHGRTVEQKYLGPSRWSFLTDLVHRYKDEACRRDFTIMGSGDIWTAQDIFEMIRQTRVDGVSVARGCIGNPWIFEQARALQRGDTEAAKRAPTIEQQRSVLLDHFSLSVGLHGEHSAGMMMRKFGIKFARHHSRRDEVAEAFIAVKNLRDWQSVIDEYYTVEQPVAV